MMATVLTTFRTLYWKAFCIEDWNIGVVPLPAGGIEELLTCDRLGKVNWRKGTPRHGFLADPFFWAHPDSPRVLVEEFDYLSARGHISSLSLEGLLQSEDTKEEIAPPCHASYPCVLHSDGSWYCIPECAESSAVDLYVWNAATGRWQFDSRLLNDVSVYDPTLVAHDGLWYLFGTLKNDGPNSKLRIWFSEGLRGPWQSHRVNPARIAPDQARSAGPVFRVNDHLYRPSQDARGGYGSGIILNRIDLLTPSSYEETPVREWGPEKDSLYRDGLHTICFTATSVIVDGKRVRVTPFAAMWKLWWHLKRAQRRA